MDKFLSVLKKVGLVALLSAVIGVATYFGFGEQAKSWLAPYQPAPIEFNAPAE